MLNLNVGDLCVIEWTRRDGSIAGRLERVTKLTPKRVHFGFDVFDRATERNVETRRRDRRCVTDPVVIASYQAKAKTEREAAEAIRREREALEATRHYKLARAIYCGVAQESAEALMAQWTEAQLAAACDALGIDKREGKGESS